MELQLMLSLTVIFGLILLSALYCLVLYFEVKTMLDKKVEKLFEKQDKS